jgi:hypothetical protein
VRVRCLIGRAHAAVTKADASVMEKGKLVAGESGVWADRRVSAHGEVSFFYFLFCFFYFSFRLLNPNFKLNYKCPKINPSMRYKLYLFLVLYLLLLFYLGNVFLK